MKQPKVRSISIVYLIIFICGIALILWIFKTPTATKVTNIPISQVVTMSQANEIKSINVQGQNLSIIGTDGTPVLRAYLGSTVSIYQVTGLNLNPPVVVTFQAPGIDWLSIILTYGIGLIFIILIISDVLPSTRRQ